MSRRAVVLLIACWQADFAAAAAPALSFPPVPAGFSGAILVARGDEILAQRPYGFADAANDEPNTAETRFRIGSLTKAITATAVLILADEERIQLHDPIAARWRGWPAAWEAVTPHDLLIHAAGIADYTARPDFPASWRPVVTAEKLISRLGGDLLPPRATNASQYSNSHYVLLGELVGRTAGENYTSFVAARVFVPADMTRTAVLGTPQSAASHAVGYTGDVHAWQPADELPPGLLPAAGDAASTVGDLHRFVRALESASGLLHPKSRELMWTAQGGNQGYGWTAARQSGEPIWISVGKVRGFSAAMLRAPGVNLVAVVLANRDKAPSLEVAFDLVQWARQPAP